MAHSFQAFTASSVSFFFVAFQSALYAAWDCKTASAEDRMETVRMKEDGPEVSLIQPKKEKTEKKMAFNTRYFKTAS